MYARHGKFTYLMLNNNQNPWLPSVDIIYALTDKTFAVE